MMLEIPGGNALGGKDIDRHKLVVDAFFREYEADDAYIDAVLRPVDDGLAHLAYLSGHRLLQVLVDLVEETGGRKPWLVGADQERQVLGHEA